MQDTGAVTGCLAKICMPWLGPLACKHAHEGMCAAYLVLQGVSRRCVGAMSARSTSGASSTASEGLGLAAPAFGGHLRDAEGTRHADLPVSSLRALLMASG